MVYSRRKFLTLSGQALALGSLAYALDPRLLMAQSISAGTGKNVIVVNLLGGCDGLAAYPYYEGSLADIVRNELRPTIYVPLGSVIPIANQSGAANKIGLNPALAPLANVAGSHIKLIQNYGIPGDPGRSHDTCQVLMSMGLTHIQGAEMVGFMARLMDSQNWESFQYWALSITNPSDVNTVKKPPVMLTDLGSFDYQQVAWESEDDLGQAIQIQRELVQAQVARSNIGNRYLTSLGSMHNALATVRRDISSQSVGNNSAGNYSEGGLGPNFRDAAKILKAKVTSSAFGQQDKDTLLLLAQGGYDTHSDQNAVGADSGALANSLGDLASNLAVFYKDLEGFGALNNTVIVLYSEFGRTLYENGTNGETTVGTDHGHGNHTMVIGGAVSAGVLGHTPGSSELRDNDYNALVPSTDFRDIFSDILVWLGVGPSSIFTENGYTHSELGIFS
ncbi:MAG: DUF1501 domain-containing protein [Oligoflexia bacterium]|nr:DUF1501 domain-containing protein [Oligoflexia bacterium]